MNCISFSSDISFAVTGSDDRRVRVFNVKTKQCVITLQGHEGKQTSYFLYECTVDSDLPLMESCGLKSTEL